MTKQTFDNTINIVTATNFIFDLFKNRSLPDWKRKEAIQNILLAAFAGGQGMPIFSPEEVKQAWQGIDNRLDDSEIDVSLIGVEKLTNKRIIGNTKLVNIQGTFTSIEIRMLAYWLQNSDLFKLEGPEKNELVTD